MIDIPAKIAETLLHEMQSGLFPGAVVMFGRPGEVLYHQAFGQARLRPEHAPMRPDTVFDIASVTKVAATATAAAICVDDGLFEFTDPVATYLPKFNAPGAKMVTIADLGTHTAGVDNSKFQHLAGEAMLEAMQTAPLTWPPQTVCEYSCRGFILLGLIIEAVTHKPLADFCHERIFRPLDMHDTLFRPPDDLSRLAGSERENPGEVSDGQARLAGRPVGNAGVFSTAPDLARFAEMMLGCGMRGDARVLSQKTHQQIISRLTPSHLPARGFGWDLRTFEESPSRGCLLSARAYGHTGWTGQSLWIDPEFGLYVIILTNRTHPVCRDNHEACAKARARITDALLATVIP